MTKKGRKGNPKIKRLHDLKSSKVKIPFQNFRLLYINRQILTILTRLLASKLQYTNIRTLFERNHFEGQNFLMERLVDKENDLKIYRLMYDYDYLKFRKGIVVFKLVKFKFMF